MLDNNKKIYTLGATLFGLAFPTIAIIIELLHKNIGFTISNIIELHLQSSFLFVIEMAPFVLGLVGYFIGSLLDRLIDKNELVIKTSEINRKNKDAFLANMSHEIRTPMNAIIGLNNLMLKKKDLDDKQVQYLNAIQINSKNLLGIINDILDFSKIEEGQLSLVLSPFNLNEKLNELYITLFESGKNKDVRLELILKNNISHLIVGDWLRLNQILSNLTSNAIKFADKGIVKIVVEQIEETGKDIDLKFSVIDNGLGIKEENLDKILEPFSQENKNTAHLFGGTGLGLNIVTSLLELYNSKLNIESEFGEGTTMSFKLKFTKSLNDINKSTITENEIIFKNLRVLLVDNDDFMRTNTVFMFEDINESITVDEAVSSEEGGDKMSNNKYDLILIDINMFENIKKGLKLNTPIIVMSNNQIKETDKIAEETMVVAYLTKPYTNDELIDTITTKVFNI